MLIEFSQIPDKLKYSRDMLDVRKYHNRVVSYFLNEHRKLSMSDKREIVNMLNKFVYAKLSNDYITSALSDYEVVRFISDYDPDVDIEEHIRRYVPSLLVKVNDIDWSYFDNIEDDTAVNEQDDSVSEISDVLQDDTQNGVNDRCVEAMSSESNDVKESKDIQIQSEVDNAPSISSRDNDSTKEDLFIQGPKVPRFDVNAPFLYQVDGNDVLAIYTTLPLVPSRQCEISCTTDVNLFSDSDLMKLYPNKFIPTRSDVMYDVNLAEKYSLEYDDMLGILIPIQGFTMKEVRDNIIEYPHIFKLMKRVDNSSVNFYSTVELEGELHKITEVWGELEDTKRLPKSKDFMKEYVVRRYLLERDRLEITHKYSMLGSLDPFLTLFMSSDDYLKYGYYDKVGMARSCVNSRVEYHRSRNPILRRLGYYV